MKRVYYFEIFSCAKTKISFRKIPFVSTRVRMDNSNFETYEAESYYEPMNEPQYPQPPNHNRRGGSVNGSTRGAARNTKRSVYSKPPPQNQAHQAPNQPPRLPAPAQPPQPNNISNTGIPAFVQQYAVDPARKLFHTRKAHILHQCYNCWTENERDPQKISYEGNKTCITLKFCENCRVANISMWNQYYAAGFGYVPPSGNTRENEDENMT